jgi:hypothetical protein
VADALEAKILKKLYAWLVVGGVAIGGVGGTGVLRVDKFTGSDARDMKADLMKEIHRIDSIQIKMGWRMSQVEIQDALHHTMIDGHVKTPHHKDHPHPRTP